MEPMCLQLGGQSPVHFPLAHILRFWEDRNWGGHWPTHCSDQTAASVETAQGPMKI